VKSFIVLDSTHRIVHSVSRINAGSARNLKSLRTITNKSYYNLLNAYITLILTYCGKTLVTSHSDDVQPDIYILLLLSLIILNLGLWRQATPINNAAIFFTWLPSEVERLITDVKNT
jgi:hypothetical protein